MNMNFTELKKMHFDSWLLFLTILLVGCGVIMVYSSSAVLAQERFGDSYFYLKRTLAFAVVGFIAMAIALKVPYRIYYRLVYPILIGSLILVFLVFIPQIGKTIGGATRWINLGPVAFQPSELAKVAMIIFLAYSLEKKAEKIRSFSIGLVPHLLVMFVVAGSILAQKDFGAAAMIAAITWFMLFAAGAKKSYLFGMIALLIPFAYMFLSLEGYRKRRILAFLNPWSDQYGAGFQIIQSFVAFNEGGWLGRGLGEGRQKLFYLPEAHTDFIFSVIGEEMGLIGVIAVIVLFALFCYRGLHIALQAPDMFGRYLATGGTLLICLSAVFNMGVVMGLLPTKGMVLPFISYGGSSLVVLLVVVGILLNISSYKRVEEVNI
ncbi:MAG: putative lipid II flippase FtsW [Pseudomonadota bacterium]